MKILDIAERKKCQRCEQQYFYMLKEDYDRKNKQDLIPRQYKHEISYNKRMCIDCNNDLVREQFRIMLRRERDFKTISNYEKFGMFAEGLLPSDICFFCGDRIPAEVSHNPKDIYRCEECTDEVSRLNSGKR